MAINEYAKRYNVVGDEFEYLYGVIRAIDDEYVKYANEKANSA